MRALRTYGVFAWWWAGQFPRTGYADLRAGVVHLLVVRWLLWLPAYRRYTEDRLAHEWMHLERGDGWHDPEPGDVMSARVWGRRTDKLDALKKSEVWRAEVRSW